MTSSRTFFLAAAAASLLSAPVLAQEGQFKLPEQCGASPAAAAMPSGTAPSDTMHGADTAGGSQSGGMGSGSQSGGMGMGSGDMGSGGMMDMMGMMRMMGMGDMKMENMPEHVQENMRRMMASMPAMHQGMMNEDADVAFACGMIAHHQGAIDMAQVVLDHGDDEAMRTLAEKIIADQTREIEEMTTWLAENAK